MEQNTPKEKQDMLDRKINAGEKLFDKLFSSFSKDVKTTGLVCLTMLAIFQQIKINNLNKENQDRSDKMFERVIQEVEKRQDPRFRMMENKIDTMKMVSDSSWKDIQSTNDRIRTVAGKVEKSVKSK